MTAVAKDSNAILEIKLGDTVIQNESTATWETGENTLTVKVTNGTGTAKVTKTYTVTVTKS